MRFFQVSGRTSTQERTLKGEEARSFRLTLANGVFARAGFLFIDADIVLSAFVKQLTNSNIMVGLISSTMRAGWTWPQLFISNLLEHRPRKMPFYVLGCTGRLLAWTIIPILTLLIGNRSHQLLFACFYIFYFLGNSFLGVSTIPFNDIVAKSIPARRRARLFGLRQLLGGILGIGVGFLIRYILSEGFYLSFPHNYAPIFGLAVFAMTISSLSFMMVREPISPVRDSRRPLWQHLKRGPYFLKVDRDYRYFAIFRIVSSLGIMCTPFYVPYALDRIGVSTSTVGLFTAVGSISAVLSNILWSYAGERFGSRILLISSTSLLFIAPIIATSVRYIPVPYQTVYYFSVFIVTQVYLSGSDIAYITYSLNLSPSMSRPTYLGFLNTLIFPISFVPVLAGALLKIMSYEALFILSAGMSALATYFAFSLSEVDGKVHQESEDN